MPTPDTTAPPAVGTAPDVADRVESVAILAGGDLSGLPKAELRDALVKLIDGRIAARAAE